VISVDVISGENEDAYAGVREYYRQNLASTSIELNSQIVHYRLQWSLGTSSLEPTKLQSNTAGLVMRNRGS
jgi:hypothetical protein